MYQMIEARFTALRGHSWRRVLLTALGFVPFALAYLVGRLVSLLLWLLAAVVAGYQRGREAGR